MSRQASASAAGLVVVGAINVDMVVIAAALPGPGETVVGDGPMRHGGGKGANAAVAAARAGAPVQLIGAVGGDALAEIALADLRHAAVKIEGVATLPQAPTGVALIVVDGTGENQIAVGAGANGALDPVWAAERLAAAFRCDVRCLLVSTEIPGPVVAAAVRAAAAHGITCILNPAPPSPAVLEVLDAGPVLTPNARELDLLTAMLEGRSPQAGADRTAVREQAASLADRTRQPVVVTLGGAGALIVQPDGESDLVGPPRVDAVDTTGAGDTFNGVLAARLTAGDEVADAVRVAVLAASMSVRTPGARSGMPHREDLEAALPEQWPEPVGS